MGCKSNDYMHVVILFVIYHKTEYCTSSTENAHVNLCTVGSDYIVTFFPSTLQCALYCETILITARFYTVTISVFADERMLGSAKS